MLAGEDEEYMSHSFLPPSESDSDSQSEFSNEDEVQEADESGGNDRLASTLQIGDVQSTQHDTHNSSTTTKDAATKLD